MALALKVPEASVVVIKGSPKDWKVDMLPFIQCAGLLESDTAGRRIGLAGRISARCASKLTGTTNEIAIATLETCLIITPQLWRLLAASRTHLTGKRFAKLGEVVDYRCAGSIDNGELLRQILQMPCSAPVWLLSWCNE